MRRLILALLLLLFLPFTSSYAQQSLSPLTVEKIMRDPKWVGTSPSNVFWSPDSKSIFFNWNPDQAPSDSLYVYRLSDKSIRKANAGERKLAFAMREGSFNKDRTLLAYSLEGSIYCLDPKTGSTRLGWSGSGDAGNPVFFSGDHKIAFTMGGNLFAWNRDSGSMVQLTDFQNEPHTPAPATDSQAAFLGRDALENSSVMAEREAKKKSADSLALCEKKTRLPRVIQTGGQIPQELVISPDGRFISYRLSKESASPPRSTIVPEYVTASGYIEEMRGRTNVGGTRATYTEWIYDRQKDTVYQVITASLPGIRDLPDYLKEYPTEDSAMRKSPPLREVVLMGPYWNPGGTHALVVVRSQDFKDRWIMSLDPGTGKLDLLDRQRDEAWVDGPGIGWSFSTGNLGWVNDSTCWFQSEASGYSHLYLENIRTAAKKALDSGRYEVWKAELSRDKSWFFITTNQDAPGQRQAYRLDIESGRTIPLTSMPGGNQSYLSPDNRKIALLHSGSNHPWELWLEDNHSPINAVRITDKSESPQFLSYPWRAPQIITFTDSDGMQVYARLFRPAKQAATRPGVIFIHGAGYLQDAHSYWSDAYFREYFFENLLTDEGYTVMDIDYRGSAGYGRDWRTAIYRHMGGKDLDDIVDGARYMADSLGVDPSRIGIWGGSYGGFLTLMALFTRPGVFACGGALRSVTDWAHYNHEYTAAILNEPAMDSLAYIRSSPIYFAAGLKDHLLMCHGMQDTNVHFQDIVRLTEKLIELGKTHWNLAVYPMEDHGFTDASSWTDEYRRIHDLFTTYLLGPH